MRKLLFIAMSIGLISCKKENVDSYVYNPMKRQKEEWVKHWKLYDLTENQTSIWHDSTELKFYSTGDYTFGLDTGHWSLSNSVYLFDSVTGEEYSLYELLETQDTLILSDNSKVYLFKITQ